MDGPMASRSRAGTSACSGTALQMLFISGRFSSAAENHFIPSAKQPATARCDKTVQPTSAIILSCVGIIRPCASKIERHSPFIERRVKTVPPCLPTVGRRSSMIRRRASVILACDSIVLPCVATVETCLKIIAIHRNTTIWRKTVRVRQFQNKTHEMNNQ